jgi:GNAT superfamily N-acetyltransferase
MTRHPVTTCTRSRPYGDPRAHTAAQAFRRADLADLAEAPWRVRVGRETLTIRRSVPQDLAGVAHMYRRCSARTLLDGYRLGGRPPSVVRIDSTLREPLAFVAQSALGAVVAVAFAARDPWHSTLSAAATVVVEDDWQGLGLGSELASHLAGSALVTGYAELIGYPGPAVPEVQRLMSGVGRTRVVSEAGVVHLHTSLPEGAGLGIGAVRVRLAG